MASTSLRPACNVKHGLPRSSTWCGCEPYSGRDKSRPHRDEPPMINAAGLPKLSHSLRHTFASALIHAGLTDFNVAIQLGHRDAATTRKFYVHIFHEVEQFDRAGAALDAAFGSMLCSAASRSA